MSRSTEHKYAGHTITITLSGRGTALAQADHEDVPTQWYTLDEDITVERIVAATKWKIYEALPDDKKPTASEEPKGPYRTEPAMTPNKQHTQTQAEYVLSLIDRMTVAEKQRAELLEALGGMVRIVEAYRYTAGLGKNQVERHENAKALLAKLKAGVTP